MGILAVAAGGREVFNYKFQHFRDRRQSFDVSPVIVGRTKRRTFKITTQADGSKTSSSCGLTRAIEIFATGRRSVRGSTKGRRRLFEIGPTVCEAPTRTHLAQVMANPARLPVESLAAGLRLLVPA
jgi:hypothetical protein